MATPSTSVPPEHARLQRLLSNGYLPAEVPPPFTSVEFGSQAVKLLANWDPREIRKFLTTPEAYSMPRYGDARRKQSIVNPINQLRVAHLVSQNWAELENRLRRSGITEFKPEITLTGAGRAVPGIDFDGVSRRRAEILGSYGRYVKTDITRFYPSIYTHSIPWAIHGKDWVKRNYHTSSFKNGFSNQLDEAVRNGQQGQTIGLPIGPDTSRIFSELIATEIEEICRRALPDLNHRAVRYLDDMLVGLREDEASATVLSNLSSALYEFELELSADKTVTLGVGSAHSPEWRHYIRTFEVSANPNKQRDDLDSFFEQVLHLADANVRDNVLRFAAKRATGFDIAPANLAHLTRWLLYSARRAPSCLSFVAEHLAAISAGTDGLPAAEIKDYILDQIPDKAEFAHTDEVAWLLFWAREIGLTIPGAALRGTTDLRSSVLALLTLDLNQRGLIGGSPDCSLWQGSATADGLKSEMWLVAYEATKKGWWPRPQPNAYILQQRFFSDLWNLNVQFYDISKRARDSVSPAFRVASTLLDASGGVAGYPD